MVVRRLTELRPGDKDGAHGRRTKRPLGLLGDGGQLQTGGVRGPSFCLEWRCIKEPSCAYLEALRLATLPCLSSSPLTRNDTHIFKCISPLTLHLSKPDLIIVNLGKLITMTFNQNSERSPLLAVEPPSERPHYHRQPSTFDTHTLHPQKRQHEECHLDYNDVLRDVIIGFSDGLTVPFALTAGLSSLGSAKVVILAGIAELFSGMISMGLGAYLAAVTERDHYASQEQREVFEVENMPDAEKDEVYDILGQYHISRAAATPLVDELCKNPQQWVRFMMDFELKLEKPNVHRAWISAVTMGLSYFIGGLIPMIPYFVMDRVREALFVSIGITVAVLLVFGYVKNYVAIRNHRAGVWGAVQTLVIGMLAAGTSYAIVRSLDRKDN